MVWYAPISQTTTVTAPNAGDGDNNGSAAGAAVEFATLATKPILSAGDFVVT